ncbi:MAG: UDP-N-acetylmuramoyl-tripeptide--D-alanyl-D-alanine ligase [Actinobacteria bacterium]|nr:UDP-N-acetylmuramoyl-tripeptide--D-alanyl-D-alanine ligase [Actinomycetota bacterium]
MIALDPSATAAALGATLHGDGAGAPAGRAVIDSREAGPGDLFFGLPGENHDGGAHAPAALAAGAWGVVVAREHAAAAAAAAGTGQSVFAVDDPVVALGALANRWRHELAAKVIGVTGSTGKTSTKDILAALIGKTRNIVATPANLNTEIGLPLTILGAPAGTEVLVLEMGMRGPGQIAELAEIADPDVGCIVNVGPVHLELLGSVEAVAAAKAELISGLAPGSTAVVPAGEHLLAPYLRDDVTIVAFGEGGDVRLADEDSANSEMLDQQTGDRQLRIVTPHGEVAVAPSFGEEYLVRNLLAAVACAQAIGAPVEGPLDVRFSALRGELLELLGGVTVINDCYNANPLSMRAALGNLSRARGRRLAVLGGMAELGEGSDAFHAEVAGLAAEAGVEMLITVGDLGGAYGDRYVGAIEHVASPEAAAYVLRKVARPGDTVLIKGSRSVGLEKIAEILEAGETAAAGRDGGER